MSIRVLSMDAVATRPIRATPGAPMGMADIAEVLWRDFLKYNPANPHWWDRDRFVLSNGHASMLLYSLLYLTGYPLEHGGDRANFRQLGSRTAGHPEHELDIGIETTTGPLGQGLANGVGMALAEKILAAHFNRPGLPIIDHHTWVFCGDGCLMEGHLARGLFAGRHAQARQADRVLRRQRHLDRRQGQGLVRRRHARSASRPMAGTCRRVDGHDADALAAGHRARRRPRPSGHRSSAARPSSAGARPPRPAPRPRTARRWARRKWPVRASSSAGRSAVRGAPRSSGGLES